MFFSGPLPERCSPRSSLVQVDLAQSAGFQSHLGVPFQEDQFNYRDPNAHQSNLIIQILDQYVFQPIAPVQ